ncbi:MAG: hypothetical protein ACRBM6_08760 [Geminicoccales bacterium]
MSTDKLMWWDRLGKTDPAHTKGFSRPGGFKGTAVKPIYQIQKMTEHFGPCGSAWKISEPTFTLVNCEGGEVAVFCNVTVSIKANGDFSAPIPGVGGDMVVKKFRNGNVFIDDESYKKAYTDAVGNALKFLGMSADIHMGQFDDAKYVQELRREKAEEERHNQTNNSPQGSDSWNHGGTTKQNPSQQANDHFAHLGGGAGDPLPYSFRNAKEIAIAIDECENLTNLALIDNAMHQVIGRLKESNQTTLMNKVKARKEELMREAA